MRIKPKIGICIDCQENGFKDIPQPLIAKRCKYHYWIHRKGESEKKEKHTKVKLIETAYGTSEPQSGLIIWFEFGIKNLPPICENCGENINFNNREEAFGSQAHILPKAHFKSIQTNLFNRLILCRFGNFCHAQYDSNWANAQKMPVFKLAKERFKKFDRYIIFPEERRRIPECFLID